jgi:hypothetical protein
MISQKENNDPHLMKLERSKSSGMNHLWDGPLDTSGYPMGQGSSSGKYGMKIKQYPCKESNVNIPITQKAKNR